MNETRHVLFDPETYGRLARAARIIAGYDRVEDVPAAVLERCGVEISARSIYGIERGERAPSIEQYFALALTYAPPGGSAYWDTAFSLEVSSTFTR